MKTFLKDRISDYLSSQYYMFLDPSLKEHAESLLNYFIEKTNENFSFNDIKISLNEMAKLDLPLTVKKGIPHLLDEFFSFLNNTGSFGNAKDICESISIITPSYLNSFRDDGTVKGETFVKKYSDTGRNDPCPCGSGKKFKKCCMKLIS